MDERIGNLLVGDEERSNLEEVVRSQRLFRYHPSRTAGPSFSDRLEQAVEERLNAGPVLALANATAGLHIALIAVGVCPGDRVLVPAYSFLATATAVLHAGALPVFVDVDDTYGMCPHDLERKLDPGVKAVVVAHLQGAAADIEPIRALCQRRGVPLVEDAAQAFGVTVGGRPVGTFGDVGVYSLQSNKVIVSGEGALMVARTASLRERIRSLHDQGCTRSDGGMPLWGDGVQYGFNFKITELAAAVALAQLGRLADIRDRLAVRSELVHEAVRGCPVLRRRSVDPSGEIGVSVAFVPETPDPGLLERLQAAHLPVQRFYATPLYRHPIFWNLASPYRNGFPFQALTENPYRAAHCRQAEALCATGVWLMLNPVVPLEPCRHLARTLRAQLTAPLHTATAARISTP